MRFLWLVLIFAAVVLPALAQQSDPGQAFAAEWQGKILAEQHVANSAQALLQAFQQQRQQLDTAKTELDYWHRWCGQGPGCQAEEQK